MSDSLRPHGLQPSRLLCSWDSTGKNPGAGCQALLPGTFLTQGLDLHLSPLLNGQASFLPLCHLGAQECVYLSFNLLNLEASSFSTKKEMKIVPYHRSTWGLNKIVHIKGQATWLLHSHCWINACLIAPAREAHFLLVAATKCRSTLQSEILRYFFSS